MITLNFSWNQHFSNFFSKNVDLTKKCWFSYFRKIRVQHCDYIFRFTKILSNHVVSRIFSKREQNHNRFTKKARKQKQCLQVLRCYFYALTKKKSYQKLIGFRNGVDFHVLLLNTSLWHTIFFSQITCTSNFSHFLENEKF